MISQAKHSGLATEQLSSNSYPIVNAKAVCVNNTSTLPIAGSYKSLPAQCSHYDLIAYSCSDSSHQQVAQIIT